MLDEYISLSTIPAVCIGLVSLTPYGRRLGVGHEGVMTWMYFTFGWNMRKLGSK